MKYANAIEDFLAAFGPEPLSDGEIKNFYYDGTMENRTGDPYESPIDDIHDGCTSGISKAYLLLGHKGCGKSTELNVLREKLEARGYRVKAVRCALEMDMINPATWDLLVLMAEKLLQIADETNCKLDAKILQSLSEFWDDEKEIREIIEERNISAEAGAAVESPSLLKIVLNIFAKVSAELKLGKTTRKEIRSTVEKRASQWISYINFIADKVADTLGGKRPVLIVEDVDKIDPKHVWELFYNYAAILSQMPFSVVYTFPISLSYSAQYAALDGYFTSKTLPMIKIKTAEGEAHREGIEAIKCIVKKRADLALFDDQVLERMIEKTGGSIRDLFSVITNAAKRSLKRLCSAIEMEDAERALEELKSSLTRRIESKDYKFLKDIRDGNKYRIEDREMLLKMMQASVVLEYNGERWHDVHPLVADFLTEHDS